MEPSKNQLLFLPPQTNRNAVTEATRVHIMRESYRRKGRRRKVDEREIPGGGTLHVWDINAVSTPVASISEERTVTQPPGEVPKSNAKVSERQGPTSARPVAHTKPSREKPYREGVFPVHRVAHLDDQQLLPATNIMPRSVHADIPSSRMQFGLERITFLMEGYGPSVYKRSGYEGHGKDSLLLHHIYAIILHDDMIFSACVALSSVITDMRWSHRAELSRLALWYLTRSLSQLRARLELDGAVPSDQCLLAISIMIVVETLVGHADQARIHMAGLQRILQLKRPRFAPFHSALANQSNKDNDAESSQDKLVQISASGVLTSLSSVSRCDENDDLPAGFQKLHAGGHLNPELVDLIRLVNKDICSASKRYVQGPSSRNPAVIHACGMYSAKCMALSRQLRLSIAERVITFAILSICYFADSAKAFERFINPFLQMNCFFSLDVQMKGHVDPELLTWAATVLELSLGPDTLSYQLAGRMRQAASPNLAGRHLIQTCTKYLWNDSMMMAYFNLSSINSAMTRQVGISGSSEISVDPDFYQSGTDIVTRWIVGDGFLSTWSDTIKKFAPKNS